MTIQITESVIEPIITIDENGFVVTIKPVVCVECNGFDGIINGGTA